MLRKALNLPRCLEGRVVGGGRPLHGVRRGELPVWRKAAWSGRGDRACC